MVVVDSLMRSRASLVCRFERVRRVCRPVQRDEKALHVPVDAAFTNLIRDCLDERVVSAFRFGTDLHIDRNLWSAHYAAKSSRARGGRDSLESKLLEERIGRLDGLSRRQRCSIEVSHACYLDSPRAGNTSCIQSMRSSFFVESRAKRIATAHCPDVMKCIVA